MKIALDKKTCDILREWYPELNFKKIKIIKGGLIAWFFSEFFNAAAVTVRNGIHLTRKSYWDSTDPYNIFGLSLLIHELKHVEQYQAMGLRFSCKYMYDWARAGFKYSRKLPLEEPAYKIGEEFLNKAKGVSSIEA